MFEWELAELETIQTAEAATQTQEGPPNQEKRSERSRAKREKGGERCEEPRKEGEERRERRKREKETLQGKHQRRSPNDFSPYFLLIFIINDHFLT